MAQTVKIISDSTCDLSKDLLEKYDISILPLHILLGETEYRDGIDITPEEMEYSVRCMDYFERCALKVYRMLLEGRGNRH